MTIEPIVFTVVVAASPQQVFDAFVKDFAQWWPMAPFSISQGSLSFEPKLGGQIVETSLEGQAHLWGHVTNWVPARKLGIAWYVGRTADKATQISVEFNQTDDGRTGVTLTQSGWEALGGEALSVRDRNDAGWRTILTDHFAPFVQAQHQTTGKEQHNV